MKTFSFGMNRSRCISLLIGILCLVLLIMMLSPYFTYGQSTTTLVPQTADAKTDGAQEVLYGRTWVLSGSSEDDEDYKALTVSKDGKNSTLKTTNKLRVNQQYALKVFNTALANYEEIHTNLDDSIAAENDAWARYFEIGKLCNDVAKRIGKDQFTIRSRSDEVVEEEEESTEEAAEEVAVETTDDGNDPYAEDYKVLSQAMTTAERQLNTAISSRETAQDCMDDAKTALDAAYKACLVVYGRNEEGIAIEEGQENYIDPSFEWVRVTSEAYNEALAENFEDDYVEAVLVVKDKDFKAWIAEQYAEEYSAFLGEEKDSTRKKNEFYEKNFSAKSEEEQKAKKLEYFDSVKDNLGSDESKVYEQMNALILERMSAEEKDNIVYGELDAMLKVSNAAYSDAKTAESLTTNAQKNGAASKTSTKAQKAVTQIETRIKAVQEVYDKYFTAATTDDTTDDTEATDETATETTDTAADETVTEDEAPVIEEASLPHKEQYLATIVDPNGFETEQTEALHMESTATVKYTKGTVKIDFANGESKETAFATELSYDKIQKLSILGFVAFPEDYADTFEKTVADYKIPNYSRNSVVLIPIILFLLLVIGIVIAIVKRDSFGSGICPTAAGILGLIGFIFNSFLKLGDNRVAFIVMFAVLLVVGCLQLCLGIKDKRKAIKGM